MLGALRAVARAADGRAPTTLLQERLLARLGLRQPQELIGWMYGGGQDRASVAALAPLVLETAEAGDGTALALVEQGVEQLALAAAAVVRALVLAAERLPLALAGGLLVAGAGYRERFVKALAGKGIVPDPVTLVDEPARGAVRLATTALRPLPPPRPQ
jgi:N-acetylglucosamine kinase-like BadF-type ATPase